MSATFIDYTIAIGLMLMTFAAVVGVATGFAASVQTEIKVATLQTTALSLLDLSNREWAFDDSISGLGLAVVIDDGVPKQTKTIISADALQLLASKQYGDVREDFDFRIRIFDADDSIAFSYGPVPPVTDVVVLQKPVLYESATIKIGTFMIEVW